MLCVIITPDFFHLSETICHNLLSVQFKLQVDHIPTELENTDRANDIRKSFIHKNILQSHQIPKILLKSSVSSLAKSTKIIQQWALYFFLTVWSQSTEEKITVVETKQCTMTEDKCVQLLF